MDNREYCEIMDNSNFMIDFQNPYDIKIKEALEKQIPKKPLIRYENMGFGVSPNESIKIYGCPCCKEDTDGATYFCQNCGQKIDWESEIEK